MNRAAEAASDFQAVFQSRVRPAVAALEVQRLLTFFGAIVGGLLMMVVGARITGAIATVPFLAPATPILFLVSFAAGLGGAAVLIWRLNKSLPARLMQTIAGGLGLTYTAGEAGDLAGFDQFSLAPTQGTRTVQGSVRGQELSGVPCDIVEVQDVRGLGKSLFTTYHGFLGRSSWPKAFPASVVIKREGLGGEAPSGLQRVGLVDSEFERRFEVYSDDQIEARVLLDPVEIERWVELDGEIGGRLQCAFAGQDVLWAVTTVNLPSGRDAWPAAYRSLNKPHWIEALARDLHAAARLGELLHPAEAWTR